MFFWGESVLWAVDSSGCLTVHLETKSHDFADRLYQKRESDAAPAECNLPTDLEIVYHANGHADSVRIAKRRWEQERLGEFVGFLFEPTSTIEISDTILVGVQVTKEQLDQTLNFLTEYGKLNGPKFFWGRLREIPLFDEKTTLRDAAPSIRTNFEKGKIPLFVGGMPELRFEYGRNPQEHPVYQRLINSADAEETAHIRR